MQVRAMTPKEAGVFAKAEGQKLSANPYAKGTKPHRQWLAGYNGGTE
jgi:hypothetical protein